MINNRKRNMLRIVITQLVLNLLQARTVNLQHLAAENRITFVNCEQSSTDIEGRRDCLKAMDLLHYPCKESTSSATLNKEPMDWWQGFFDEAVKISAVRIVSPVLMNDFVILDDYDEPCNKHGIDNPIKDKIYSCNTTTKSLKIQLGHGDVLQLCEVIPMVAADAKVFEQQLFFSGCLQSALSKDIETNPHVQCTIGMDSESSTCITDIDRHNSIDSGRDKNFVYWWKAIFSDFVLLRSVFVVSKKHVAVIFQQFDIQIDRGIDCVSNYTSNTSNTEHVFPCNAVTKSIKIKSLQVGKGMYICEVIPYGFPKTTICQEGFTYGEGFCWKLFPNEKMEHEKAVEECEKKDSTLVNLDSNAKLVDFHHLLYAMRLQWLTPSRNKCFWVNFNGTQGKENYFQWIDTGDNVSESAWMDRYPMRPATKKYLCGAMCHNTDSKLINEDCDMKLRVLCAHRIKDRAAKWSPWGACRKSETTGRWARERYCKGGSLLGGPTCVGESVNERDCSTGVWTQWFQWGECLGDCEFRMRYRNCRSNITTTINETLALCEGNVMSHIDCNIACDKKEGGGFPPWAIIVIIIGVIALLIAIATVCVICIRSKKKKKESEAAECIHSQSKTPPASTLQAQGGSQGLSIIRSDPPRKETGVMSSSKDSWVTDPFSDGTDDDDRRTSQIEVQEHGHAIEPMPNSYYKS